MRHANARVCTKVPIAYFYHLFPTIHTQITNSTRGWPLPGLLTLPTAGERSKGKEKRDTSEASVYARLCSNHPISPLIILQSSNLSLHSMFALQHGAITMTRDKQCACCIRSKQDLYVYTLFFEFILIFLNAFFFIAP